MTDFSGEKKKLCNVSDTVVGRGTNHQGICVSTWKEKLESAFQATKPPTKTFQSSRSTSL
jgi:hypothetical protein